MTLFRSFFASLTLTVILFYSSVTMGAGSAYYRNVEGAQSVIVFVHGLFGDSQTTWTAANGAFWPELIAKEKSFDNYSIYLYEYPTSMANNAFSIDEIAENMRLFFDADNVSSHKDIVFIAHSMGGLVTRAYLLKNRAVASITRLIYFYSTPTTGSQVASIAALISANPQLSKLQPMRSSDYLADLQRQWLDASFDIPSFCAYETKSTYGFNIVTQASASNLCNRPLDPLDSDHISIVKPESSRDARYLAFRSAIDVTPIGTLSQKKENEINERLKHIEALLESKDKKDVRKFLSSEGIEQKYPLGYALFYSDGRKTLYYPGSANSEVQFEPARISVSELTATKLCISGFNVTVNKSHVSLDNSCVSSRVGAVASLFGIQGVKVKMESLGGSAASFAWIIGLTPDRSLIELQANHP